MKYKIGDTVAIKPWGLLKDDIPENGWDKKSYDRYLGFTDRSATITAIHDCAPFPYSIKIRANKEVIATTENAILGYAFEYGDEIKVSDTGTVWGKDVFCCYNIQPRTILPVITKKDAYKFARPIQKETIEVTVKRNGKLIDVKNLSDETWMSIKRGE